MKKNQFQYYKTSVAGAPFRLEFSGLKDFLRFAEVGNYKAIFMLEGSNGAVAGFALLHNGGLITQDAAGFASLEDFQVAEDHNFPDADSYYKALQAGYTEYKDYKLVTEAGIDDKKIFDEINEQGFMDGWTDFNSLPKENSPLTFANPHQLYNHAHEKGFTSYAEFKDAYLKGFTDAAAFRVAQQKGYKNAADFQSGEKLGFFHAVDFEKARQIKARDKADYLRYINLEVLRHSGLAHDQCVLLSLLSKLPQHKKASVNKLLELFEKELAEYRYPDNSAMPEWFTTAFSGKEAIVDFIKTSHHVKKYGHYDSDGEYFETALLQERAVVIDGANVAHASHGSDRKKPALENIIKVVNELKKKGFVSISVIVDASLRHRVTDSEKMQQLNGMVQYLEAPAENPADIFIIQYVKRNHCLLVSNDTFRDWKNHDSWVAENIDFYRLSFMIKGDQVLMPDLNKAD